MGNISSAALPKGSGERVNGDCCWQVLLNQVPVTNNGKLVMGRGDGRKSEINSPSRKHRSHFYRQEGNSRGAHKGSFIQSISKGDDETSISNALLAY